MSDQSKILVLPARSRQESHLNDEDHNVIRHDLRKLFMRGLLEDDEEDSERPSQKPPCRNSAPTATHSDEIYRCTICECYYCDQCWAVMPPHNYNGKTHEMSRRDDFETVYDALRQPLEGATDSTRTPENHGQKHEAENMWFGVSGPQEETNEYVLYEGMAYENLMLTGPESRPSTTYPSLVSFIGETGSGKSALINLLVKFFSHKNREWATPVVSVSGSSRSTSSNVHLFADPTTFHNSNVILYADCEGIGGSEQPTSADNEHLTSYLPRSFGPTPIRWGDSKIDGTNIQSRYHFTRTLYPRMLYIFSDVVVYVLHNPRTKSKVIRKLIEWAHNATERSYNKPVLPFLIIVLNKEQNSGNQDIYSISEATERFLNDKDIKNVHQNSNVSGYTSKWQDAEGRCVIQSGHDLLKCYFTDLAVIHLPNEHCPTKMHEQIASLHEKLVEFSNASQKKRADMQMQLTASTFPLYSRKAFKQFASSYNEPFDFSEAWFDLNPVEFQFSDSILNLACNVGKTCNLKGLPLWEYLTDFIASCFLLSSRRNDIHGATQGVVPRHLEQLGAAIAEYWQRFWPCEERSPSKEDGQQQCRNSNNGHKHHQFVVGGVQCPGELTTKHTLAEIQDRIKGKVSKRTQELHREIDTTNKKAAASPRDSSHSNNLRSISLMHLERVKLFYKNKNLESFISHSVCYSCLDSAPEYNLPCGHVICTPCVITAAADPTKNLDTSTFPNGFIELKHCPLGNHHDAWRVPWAGVLKPQQAGVRTLSLDGGGIRGIIELEFLKIIQDRLCGVPLQDCFDLIVGTSTGGIISLGLCSLDQTAEECANMFSEFAEDAFTPHKIRSIPLVGQKLRHLEQLRYQSTYQQSALETALQKAFTNHRLLFDRSTWPSRSFAKVAVTSTTKDGQALLLSNYNRKNPPTPLYGFYRPGPEKDLKVWEAARATSSAPTYFTPFIPSASGTVLLDGGIYNNNPIRVADAERKAIWPASQETRCRQPDIILSIGTGFEKTELTRRSPANGADLAPALHSPDLLKADKPNAKDYARMLFSIPYDHLMNSMLSEVAWHEWLGVRSPDESNQHRYRRLNVELTKKVEMDDIKELDHCRGLVQNWVKEEDNEDTVSDIANQLLSSCFYYRFEPGDIYERDFEGYQCHGTVECRLPRGQGSSTSKLGQHWILMYRTRKFLPSFSITETHPGAERTTHPIPRETIEAMASEGEFHFALDVKVSTMRAKTQLQLSVCPGQTTDRMFTISGFPRRLQDDYEVAHKRNEFVQLTMNLLNAFNRLRRPLGGLVRRGSGFSGKRLHK